MSFIRRSSPSSTTSPWRWCWGRRASESSLHPTCIADEIRRRYKVQLVGRAKDIRQRFYAISVERKVKNPAVAAICQVARKHIFA